MGFGFSSRGRRAAKKASAVPYRGSAVLPPDAPSWPLLECRVDPRWRSPPAATPVLVARASAGRIAAACFLIDLGCLGAKNGFVRLLRHHDYAALVDNLMDNGPGERVDLALAGKIVRSGIAYAAGLGFDPHPDAVDALPFLGPELECRVHVPLGGREGKPFYVQGEEECDAVMEKLFERLGPEGFHFIVRKLPRGARIVERGPKRSRPNWFDVEE